MPVHRTCVRRTEDYHGKPMFGPHSVTDSRRERQDTVGNPKLTSRAPSRPTRTAIFTTLGKPGLVTEGSKSAPSGLLASMRRGNRGMSRLTSATVKQTRTRISYPATQKGHSPGGSRQWIPCATAYVADLRPHVVLVSKS